VWEDSRRMPKTAITIHLTDQDEQTLRRGSFAGVPDLVAAIGRYIEARNADCHPFAWVKDADQILVKAASGRRRMT
jgi:hypothetical protein